MRIRHELFWPPGGTNACKNQDLHSPNAANDGRAKALDAAGRLAVALAHSTAATHALGAEPAATHAAACGASAWLGNTPRHSADAPTQPLPLHTCCTPAARARPWRRRQQQSPTASGATPGLRSQGTGTEADRTCAGEA